MSGDLAHQASRAGFSLSIHAIGDAAVPRQGVLVTASAGVAEVIARQAGVANVRHLVDLGHRRIAFVRPHPDHKAMAGRYNGFLDGMRAAVDTPAGRMTIETPLLGRGNLANVLAAIAVAVDAGVPLDVLAAAAARLRPAEHRGAVHRLKGGITLIDDSYNSSPMALHRALEVVARETRATRRVAVLGEMLELGQASTGLHEACGRAAADAGLRLLFAIGARPARARANAAIAAGMPASAVTHVERSEQAADQVTRALRAGDLVLVKGSRGIRTDLVVDRIVAEFA